MSSNTIWGWTGIWQPSRKVVTDFKDGSCSSVDDFMLVSNTKLVLMPP